VKRSGREVNHSPIFGTDGEISDLHIYYLQMPSWHAQNGNYVHNSVSLMAEGKTCSETSFF